MSSFAHSKGIPVRPYLIGAIAGILTSYLPALLIYFPTLQSPWWATLLLLPPVAAGAVAHKLRSVRHNTSRFAFLALAATAIVFTVVSYGVALFVQLATLGAAFADPLLGSVLTFLPVMVYIAWLVAALLYETNLRYGRSCEDQD